MASNRDDEAIFKFFLITLGIAAVIFAAGFLLAIINIGAEIVTSWLLVAFQILTTVVGVLISIWVTYALARALFANITDRFNELERDYASEIKTIRRQTPAFMVTMVLVSDAVMILADKSFKGDPLPTVIVSLNLLLFFWLAHFLMNKTGLLARLSGFVLYLFSFSILPVTSLIYHKWSIFDLMNWYLSLEYPTMIMLGLSVATVIIVPPLFYRSVRMD